MIPLAAALVVVGTAGFVARALRGPSLADRVMAIDGLVVCLVSLILMRSAAARSSWFLDVAVVVAFIGFVGTTAAARFIERRGG